MIRISNHVWSIAAILSALKNLQEKIRRLELERMQAEENVKHLSRETADYKKVLTEEMQQREQSKTEVSKQNQGLFAFIFCLVTKQYQSKQFYNRYFH